MDNFWNELCHFDEEIAHAISSEEERQKVGIEMIPSENYTYPEVLSALGSVLTNKYSEGYPGRRYYGGQEFTDIIEEAARTRAKKLFKAEHANVQPLSGSPMNQAAYFATLAVGDTVLAMDLSHGGHLTHGAPVSHMGKVFRFERYKTNPDNHGQIDFDALRGQARALKPKMILCGHSSYPRDLDYQAFKAIADEVGAITMADISHIGGLVAGGVLKNPFDYGFDIVTTTTHKSLRGPRGGMILCRAEFARKIDSAVFPGLQGGPHMNNIAAAAITFKKALEPEFSTYAQAVLDNASALAATLSGHGAALITGGTENHLMVIDCIKTYGIDGAEAEKILDKVGITTNKQVIPDDTNPPLRPSGIRLGTPACTTRGMGVEDMHKIGNWIDAALKNKNNESLDSIAHQVRAFCEKFPVPGL